MSAPPPEAPPEIQPEAPGMRSFTLNSPEAYAALCPREEEPWMANGSLPREPRTWERAVIVERTAGQKR